MLVECAKDCDRDSTITESMFGVVQSLSVCLIISIPKVDDKLKVIDELMLMN